MPNKGMMQIMPNKGMMQIMPNKGMMQTMPSDVVINKLLNAPIICFVCVYNIFDWSVVCNHD